MVKSGKSWEKLGKMAKSGEKLEKQWKVGKVEKWGKVIFFFKMAILDSGFFQNR